MKYKKYLSVCFLLLLCVNSFFLISCDEPTVFYGLDGLDDYAWYFNLTLEENKHYFTLEPFSPGIDVPPQWYYTDDGSDPIKYGEMYTTPILVDRTTIIKVVLKIENAPVSNVHTFDISRRINTKLSPTIISSVYNYGNGESEFDGVITIDSSTFSVPVGTIINVERDTNTFYTLDGSVPEYGGEKFFGEITLNPPYPEFHEFCTYTV